jgi:hypothetical protein
MALAGGAAQGAWRADGAAGVSTLIWWAPDQGLRLNRRLRRSVGSPPAIASYRFRALKVSLGALMFAAGRRNLKASFRLGSLIST